MLKLGRILSFPKKVAAHLGDVVLLAVVGVGAVRVPDVILVHLLPAVIIPFPVPAHLTVAHQGVTYRQTMSVPSLSSLLYLTVYIEMLEGI